MFDNKNDDAPRIPDIGERKSGDNGDPKRRLKLEELTRFTMVKALLLQIMEKMNSLNVILKRIIWMM